MERLSIIGGVPLRGEIQAPGAKNAITKMIIASLISNKRCLFTNVPNITEVEITVALCREIGMQIVWDRESKTMEVVTKELKTTHVSQKFSGANRMPILLLGALLGRTREDISVPTVGGCKIGKRPVDYHIEAFRSLGAEIDCKTVGEEKIFLAHSRQGLKGACIKLPYSSVGATENIIFAACRAEGATLIRNAAMECEIIDLILFLQKLGVQIYIEGNKSIRVEGGSHFLEAEHHVMPDRIEAASFAMAAISTKGKVFIRDIRQEHMMTLLNKIREIGGGFRVYGQGIEFFAQRPLKGGIHIETSVHPGFMTDWQQPFVVLLTQTEGISTVHETVYEDRFGYVETLKEMGADIQLFTKCLGRRSCRFSSCNYQHSIVIRGPTTLSGQSIQIPDLRAGFAYVQAALLCSDRSEIQGLEFLDRGYEALDQKLLSLGAKVKRIHVPERTLAQAVS